MRGNTLDQCTENADQDSSVQHSKWFGK